MVTVCVLDMKLRLVQLALSLYNQIEFNNRRRTMSQDRQINTVSERDETLARAYYSVGDFPAFRIANFEYSASSQEQGLLRQISERLGARLNAPLPEAHQALIESGAAQSPEDLALVDRMTDVQRETLDA
jgi:hypothetical protein